MSRQRHKGLKIVRKGRWSVGMTIGAARMRGGGAGPQKNCRLRCENCEPSHCGVISVGLILTGGGGGSGNFPMGWGGLRKRRRVRWLLVCTEEGSEMREENSFAVTVLKKNVSLFSYGGGVIMRCDLQ